MLTFFRNHYGWVTMEEICKAAEFNIKKVSPERIEHYHSLSIDYLTQIIEKYKVEQKAETFKKLKQLENITTADNCNDLPGSLKSLIEFYKKNNVMPLAWNWNHCFDELLVDGKININEELKEWADNQKKIIKAAINSKLVKCKNPIEREYLRIQLTPDRINQELRKIYINKIIPEIINEL